MNPGASRLPVEIIKTRLGRGTSALPAMVGEKPRRAENVRTNSKYKRANAYSPYSTVVRLAAVEEITFAAEKPVEGCGSR
jgi:hypothetical protein